MKTNKGFSLVELIVVIAIMAIIAGVAIPVYNMYIDKANKAADKQLVDDILYAINIGGQSLSSGINVSQASDKGLQIPVGFIVLNNGKDKDGNAVATYSILSDSSSTQIDQILKDAMGDNYAASLKLKSDGWQGSTIPTLYADSTELYGKVQTLSGLITELGGIINTMGGNVKEDYSNGVEVVATVSNVISLVFKDEDSFVAAWTKSPKDVEETFGIPNTIDGVQLNGEGRQEAYLAIRRAYNEAVASYVEANTPDTHDTYKRTGNMFSGYSKGDAKTESRSDHIKEIAGCGNTGVGTNLIVPDIVGPHLFNETSASPDVLGEKLISKSKLSDTTQFCKNCAACVATYDTSATAEADARAFYKMMVTMNETSDEALEYAASNPRDEWGYYNDYINSFSSTYTGLENYTQNLESCIVVTIYQDSKGLLYGEVNTPGVVEE